MERRVGWIKRIYPPPPLLFSPSLPSEKRKKEKTSGWIEKTQRYKTGLLDWMSPSFFPLLCPSLPPLVFFYFFSIRVENCASSLSLLFFYIASRDARSERVSSQNDKNVSTLDCICVPALSQLGWESVDVREEEKEEETHTFRIPPFFVVVNTVQQQHWRPKVMSCRGFSPSFQVECLSTSLPSSPSFFFIFHSLFFISKVQLQLQYII